MVLLGLELQNTQAETYMGQTLAVYDLLRLFGARLHQEYIRTRVNLSFVLFPKERLTRGASS